MKIIMRQIIVLVLTALWGSSAYAQDNVIRGHEAETIIIGGNIIASSSEAPSLSSARFHILVEYGGALYSCIHTRRDAEVSAACTNDYQTRYDIFGDLEIPSSNLPDTVMSNPELMADWGQAIFEWINSTPDRPTGDGYLVARLTLRSDGTLQETSIIHSSGVPELDTALLQFLETANPFPAAPDPFPDTLYNFDLPVRLR
ncbi:TonB family protein [Roseobacter sp. HKCCD5988]|uniref:TonB family protein n=1 Tax=Roseobacter sp. HKCCD5988 TaxID=3120338 RepID=UPI0040408131